MNDVPNMTRLANADRRLKRMVIALFCGMCFAGVILPENWREALGEFGAPIEWAASQSPASAKAAQLSTMPDLVIGFFGLGLWGLLIFTVAAAWGDPLGARIQYGFSRSNQPAWKTFTSIYCLGLPTIAVVLWVAFSLPIDLAQSATSLTGGARLFHLMLQDRLALALIGSAALTGLGILLFLAVVALFGPLWLLFFDRSK